MTDTTAMPPQPVADEPALARADRPRLSSFLPDGPVRDADEILDRFVSWVAETGIELYPAQEEALLELMAGRHVVLNTPTGSGKSLVALGLQFKGLCEGRRSYYTSPIKALASEKFFSLCDELGAENVGMMTGDASINPSASVICCTAEIVSNMALRQWSRLEADSVIMDEFHYYGDRDRGAAWQIPLLVLPETRFLLMSATLGNTAFVREDLERRTGIPAVEVRSDERPVPLEWEYRETTLHETMEELVATGRAPVYVVNFTQRECAELAQGFTSMSLASREEREEVWEELGEFRFDTPYGKELRRFLRFALGVHHAGLLPKYRLLVEQLAQQGKLKVIFGTDTLGVGVNMPVRTVLFNKLAKYDGQKFGILSVRDFQQIAGRAGRKGFDDRGFVVAQAPEHVVEKKKAEEKGKKFKGGPRKGEVVWNEETFDKLRSGEPEPLDSRFQVTPSMILDTIQHDADVNDPTNRNFHSLRELIRRCHDDDRTKARHLSDAAQLVRSLSRTGILRLERDTEREYLWVVVDEELQKEFSLHQTLSPWLVEAIEELEPEDEDYALAVLSRVEAVLEDPSIVLRRQEEKAKDELIQRMKAEGSTYEERMAKLDETTYPKPDAEAIYRSFGEFRDRHAWVAGRNVSPKGIGREIFEGYLSFADFVRSYGLSRSEGVVLRYLSQLYKTLVQSVPEKAKTEAVYDVIGFFRTMLEHTDTSLLEEWESLLHPDLQTGREEEKAKAREGLRAYELFHDPRAFQARVRAELHQLLRALALEDWEEAVGSVRNDDPEHRWTEERFQEALAPFLEQHEAIRFDAEARRTHQSVIRKREPRIWDVSQTLLDPAGEGFWTLEGFVDLSEGHALEGPLVTLVDVRPS